MVRYASPVGCPYGYVKSWSCLSCSSLVKKRCIRLLSGFCDSKPTLNGKPISVNRWFTSANLPVSMFSVNRSVNLRLTPQKYLSAWLRLGAVRYSRNMLS